MRNFSWPAKKLGELADVRMGETLIKKDLIGDGTPIFSAGTDIKPWGFTKRNKLIFGKNSIVLSARGTIGAPRLPLLKKFTATQTTIVVTNKSENILDTIFLWRFLQTFNFNTLKDQAAIPMMTVRDVNKTQIPLPPIKIQKQIVARIEELFEKIDKTKELRQKAQEETTEIFQSALQEIFIKAKKEKWRKIKLDQALDLKDNGIWGPEDLQNGVPILRSTNFSNDGTINFNNVALRRIEIRNLNEKKLQKGDILLERSGGGENQPVGRVVYYNANETCYFGNFLTRLRPKKKIYSKFLFNILFSFHQQGITNYLQKQTTGIRNLRFQEYLALEIPLPPLPEQKKIVAELDNLREQIEKLKQLQQNQSEELTELKQSILSKAFKGD